MNTISYDFSFLGIEGVTERRTVQDINVLLAQLSSRREASQITELSLTRALKQNMRFLVVRHGSAIIGMGIICNVPRLVGRECEIHDIVVDKEHRRQGISREIVSRLVAEGRGRFLADKITLTSRPDRVAANELYRSCGFELRDTNCYRLLLEYP